MGLTPHGSQILLILALTRTWTAAARPTPITGKAAFLSQTRRATCTEHSKRSLEIRLTPTSEVLLPLRDKSQGQSMSAAHSLDLRLIPRGLTELIL